ASSGWQRTEPGSRLPLAGGDRRRGRHRRPGHENLCRAAVWRSVRTARGRRPRPLPDRDAQRRAGLWPLPELQGGLPADLGRGAPGGHALAERPPPARLTPAEQHTVPTNAPRLDQYLAGLLAGQSRSQVQRLIAEGHVRLNDGPARAGSRLRSGDRLSWELPAVTPTRLQPEATELRVPYEDDDLIDIDKPAGP